MRLAGWLGESSHLTSYNTLPLSTGLHRHSSTRLFYKVRLFQFINDSKIFQLEDALNKLHTFQLNYLRWKQILKIVLRKRLWGMNVWMCFKLCIVSRVITRQVVKTVVTFQSCIGTVLWFVPDMNNVHFCNRFSILEWKKIIGHVSTPYLPLTMLSLISCGLKLCFLIFAIEAILICFVPSLESVL